MFRQQLSRANAKIYFQGEPQRTLLRKAFTYRMQIFPLAGFLNPVWKEFK